MGSNPADWTQTPHIGIKLRTLALNSMHWTQTIADWTHPTPRVGSRRRTRGDGHDDELGPGRVVQQRVEGLPRDAHRRARMTHAFDDADLLRFSMPSRPLQSAFTVCLRPPPPSAFVARPRPAAPRPSPLPSPRCAHRRRARAASGGRPSSRRACGGFATRRRRSVRPGHPGLLSARLAALLSPPTVCV